MLSNEHYNKIFRSFSNIKVLVIGDVMIDSYIYGKVDRISPEAPVPVVSVQKRESRLGGAANVAMNLKALGAEPIICSVIGNDDKAKQLLDLLEDNNLIISGIVKSKNRITTTKFRIIGNNTQMLRVDEETHEMLSEKDNKLLIKTIHSLIDTQNIDIIIFEDYDKGLISPELIDDVVSLANKLCIPTVVDPKLKNFKEYRNITLFKPNLKELKEGLSIVDDLNDINNLQKALAILHQTQNIQVVLTTLSEKGVIISFSTVSNKIKFIHIPAHFRSIADVSGAGDTLVSIAALCLYLKLPPDQIAIISNLAGGLVCEEVGVVPINKERLLKELLNLE